MKLPLVSLASLSMLTSVLNASPCGTWQPGSGGNGVHAPGNPFVNAMTMWDPDGPGPRPRSLVIGGQFRAAGGTQVTNIALWNGTRWEPIGSGISSGNVFALAQHPNGDLLVGGSFTSIGSVTARYIARWNGTEWSEFAGGTNSNVASIAAGSDGFIYVAGGFSRCAGLVAGGIVRFNGSTWDTMQGGVLGIVHSMKLTSDGTVYIAGQFSQAGGVPAFDLAKWHDGQWTGYTPTQPEFIYDVHPRENGDLAIVGTKRVSINNASTSVPCAVLYNNGTWQEVPGIPQIASGFLTAIAERHGNLTFLGSIAHAGGRCATIQQSGSSWSLVPSHVADAWCAMFDDSGRLVIGGQFPLAQSPPHVQPMGHIVAYDGITPYSFSRGLDGPVLSIASSSQQVVLGGSFISADGVRLSGVCRWLDGTFEPIGPGTQSPGGQVQSVAIAPDQSIIAGRLTLPGTSASTLERWDGHSWGDLGVPISGNVHAVTTLPNGDVIAGGEPFTAGSTPLNRVGRFSQGVWSNLGTGMNGTVRHLNTLADGSVIACGDFSTAGGSLAIRIARWNGTVWQPLGSGLGGSVSCSLQDTDGSIIAAGTFISAIDANTQLRNIGRWDGTRWRAMGEGLFGTVRSLTLHRGSVIAAGTFALNGNGPVLRFARWNGTSWVALDVPPLDNDVYAVHGLPDGDLIAGGTFRLAGLTLTANFAHLKFCPAEFNCDRTTDFFDYLDFVAAFAANDPNTDLNADGTIDLFDYLDFVEHFNAGC